MLSYQTIPATSGNHARNIGCHGPSGKSVLGQAPSGNTPEQQLYDQVFRNPPAHSMIGQFTVEQIFQSHLVQSAYVSENAGNSTHPCPVFWLPLNFQA